LDFAILHKLSNRIPGIVPVSVLPYGPATNIIIQQQYVEQKRSIDLELIKRLATYRMERSKFYTDGYGSMLEEKIADVFRHTDNFINDLSYWRHSQVVLRPTLYHHR
jgi:hypothetical protein